jgi:hypothetical protein
MLISSSSAPTLDLQFVWSIDQVNSYGSMLSVGRKHLVFNPLLLSKRVI